MERVLDIIIVLGALSMLGPFIPTDGSTFGAHLRKNWPYLILCAVLTAIIILRYVPLPDALRFVSVNALVTAVQIVGTLGLVAWLALVWPRSMPAREEWWTITWIIGGVLFVSATLLWSLEGLKVSEPTRLPEVEQAD